MIPLDHCVDDAGTTAGGVTDKAMLPAISTLDASYAPMTVRRFSDMSHACHRICTTSCEAVLSNNALVWPEQGGYVLAQSALNQPRRIRVIVDGDVRWEVVTKVEPVDSMVAVASLVLPSGLIAAGIRPNARIFTTGVVSAPPNINS